MIDLGGEFMAKCANCGKEAKEGQIYCNECIFDMENDAFSDLFSTLDVQPELEDASDSSSEDDFTKILDELQGPRGDKKKENAPVSTVSDVFSDAISAISSLEDEPEENSEFSKILEQPKKEEKTSFFAKLFHKKNKLKEPKDSDEPVLDKKKLQRLEKEQARKEEMYREQDNLAKEQVLIDEKVRLKKAKEEEKKKKKAAKKAEKQEKDKEKKAKKAKKSKEKSERKKQKVKNKQEEAEVVIDYGKFNKPAFILVVGAFAFFGCYIVFQAFTVPYSKSIAIAAQKFDHQKYNQAYEEIYGLEIKNNDQELYDKIMTVMYVNKQLNSYNNYKMLELYPEALDSLVKGLKRYETYIDAAKDLGIEDDLNHVRAQILKELKKEFGLSEKKAMKLIKTESQSEYSIKIYDIVLENTDYSKK